MDAKTCIEKLGYVGVLNFATVDEDGAPQVRNVSAIHYDGMKIYFLTAKGKNFAKQLKADGRVQIIAGTKYREMIRVSGRAVEVVPEEQHKWRDIIYDEQPYLANVYPSKTRDINTIFVITEYNIEYFSLATNPITREYYSVGEPMKRYGGYHITDACVGCGACVEACPQQVIRAGTPFIIEEGHCLHCGACLEVCPAGAVVRY